MKILIADDDQSSLLILGTIARGSGFDVIQARDGTQALALFERERPDIVLLDILMPELDGLTVCRKLREKHSLTDLPILIVTAMNDDTNLSEGFDAGANDYISKPIIAAVLRARLNAQVTMLKAIRASMSAEKRIAQMRRLESLGIFSSGIAHNFNNLLGAIVSSAELIKLTSDISPSALRALELILEASRRGTTLTKSLLKLAHLPTDESCADAEQIVEQALPLLSVFCKRTVETQCTSHGTIPQVNLSPSTLSQVLVEVLKNSFEAIETVGRVEIDLYPPKSRELNFVTLKISDTGRGIPPELIEFVFDPFTSTKDPGVESGLSLSGSGFGLSTAYFLTTQAGGSIRVLETSSAGTTIELKLPVAQVVP